MRLTRSIVLGCAYVAAQFAFPSAAQITTTQTTLSNGMRAVMVHFSGSTNVSLFTFLPMGLVSDVGGRAQWSHLVEHLVIRSTVPEDSPRANAETSPDHMRLDYYGTLGDWQEGLKHQERWLAGVPFTAKSLDAEKPRVTAECDFTARNLATHKFALAAWAQAFRDGREQIHIGMKEDVRSARLEEVQTYRDLHLFVPQRSMICLVGGVSAETFFAEAEKRVGSLRSSGAMRIPGSIQPGRRDVTWDLDARHFVWGWRIPRADARHHAELKVAAAWLSARLYASPDIKTLAGMAFAGADLDSPEGQFFYVSAALRSEASFEDFGRCVDKLIGTLVKGGEELPLMARNLAKGLDQTPSLSSMLASSGSRMTPAMVEGNIGLGIAMNIYRYGADREDLARKLRAVSSAAVVTAVRQYLSGTNLFACTIRPR